MKNRHLYDRAQQLDRETDTLSFRLNSVADPAERASLQAQIDQASQRASDAWVDWRHAEDAHRRCTASVSRPPAPTPPPPALSAAEVAARRRAQTSALWKNVTKRVNERRGLGSQPDSLPAASGEAPSGKGQKQSTKSIWAKAVAEANAGLTENEPLASRERQAPSNGRPQSDFLSKAMTKASKLLKDAGYALAR